jgi:hypothetical protein
MIELDETPAGKRLVAITLSEKTTFGVTLGLLAAVVIGLYGAGWQLRGYAVKIEENSIALEANTKAVNAQIKQLIEVQQADNDRLRTLENAVLVLTTESNVNAGRGHLLMFDNKDEAKSRK